MTLSDLISFIGILLAIIAFIGEKERLFVINKFNKTDVLLIITTFLLINFLLFYFWWRKAFPILTEFEHTNLPTPNTWVYFIVILFICWLFYKIFYSKFPKNNQSRALNYYNQLLQREDYSFLYNIIVKYETKQLLEINNNSQYIDDLIKSIFLNKDFLFKTYNYNYQLFNKILLYKNSIDDILLDNYIESHMRNPNSFIYNSNINIIEQEEFHLLANRTKRLEILIIFIIRNNLVPLDKLLNFIQISSLKIDKVNELYGIILQEVIDKKDSSLVILFFIEYMKHYRSNNNTIASFQAVTLKLVGSITVVVGLSNMKNILQLYLNVILVMIDANKDELEKIIINTFKTNSDNNSKELFRMIYEIYYECKRDTSIELEIIFDKIYN